MALVQIDKLTKSYYGRQALNGVSFEIEKGEVVGLFGPNGSGKTTLIKVLAGLLMQYKGTVLIGGEKIGIKTKKMVSYLPDVNYLEDGWTVKECIKIFKKFYEDFCEEKALMLLERFNISLKSTIKSLSKGNQEKVQVILVLSRKADLYLFDEPIAGVDPASREVIFNLIKENYNKEAAVILTTHLIHDIEDITDRIIFLSEGNVMLDNTKSALEEAYPDKTIDEIFRDLFRINYRGGEF